MTSCSCRDDNRSLFTPKTSRFFKIILEDTIRDKKLLIPRKFIRKYGNHLPSPVFLKVPSGAVWKVELRKCDGEVWLLKGWKEFAEYFSLDHGHLLLFEYDANCHFNVLIFDKSATEIEYPLSSTHCEESHHNEECQELKMEETEDNNSIKILGSFSSWQKTREKSPLSSLRPHKRIRTYSTNVTENASKLHTSVPPNGTQPSVMKLDNSKRKIAKSHCSARERHEKGLFSCMQALGEYEKAKAFQRASGFKSDNPFFKVAIQPSYAHAGNMLSVPLNFAKKYFTRKRGDVILYGSDGRTWPAKYYHIASKGKETTKIFHGWRAFAQDNSLEVGDVCVFELINSSKISFKVVIFHLVEDVGHRVSPVDESRINEVEPKRNTEIQSTLPDCTSNDDENSRPGPCIKVSTKQVHGPNTEVNGDVLELVDALPQ